MKAYFDDEQEVDINHLRDHLEIVLKCFYETGDVGYMEGSLDELCHGLGLPQHPGFPVIEKMDKKKILFLSEGYRRAQLETMNKKENENV